MEFRFSVWQFVRLMVHLEKNPDVQFAPWEDVWRTVDANLCSLADQDGDAYSDMMMNQDVVIEEATVPQGQAVQVALKVVMDELDAAIVVAKAIDADDDPEDSEHLQGLQFERRELRQLTRTFKRQIEAS